MDTMNGCRRFLKVSQVYPSCLAGAVESHYRKRSGRSSVSSFEQGRHEVRKPKLCTLIDINFFYHF